NWIRNGLDEINNSEIAKKIRGNAETFSATGGIRRMDFSMPPPPSKQGNTTYVTVEGAKVDQHIVTSDPTKAGNIAAAGVNKVSGIKQTYNNLDGAFPTN
ncbi:hypothetical protein UA45_21980, partial [Morganella morganii]